MKTEFTGDKELFDLSGKSIAITGGAGYLGTAMSEALAQYGADLFILGKNKEKCENLAQRLSMKEFRNGNKFESSICEGLECDIESKLSIQKALDRILFITGKIDVLINNAAFYGEVTPFESCSDEDWLACIDGTINSMRRVTQIFIRQMITQKTGNIINIGSMYGLVSPDMSIYGNSRENNPASYGAGKAAIIQLTRYLACVYGADGIRVNCISPGAFPNIKVQCNNPEFVHKLEKKNPMGRIGYPNDLKGVIVFMSSDSSRYINGQNIMVDGGWTAW